MGSFDDFTDFDEKDWEEKNNKIPKKKRPEVSPVVWVEGGQNGPFGMNVALISYEHKGKSLLATLAGFLNTEYFNEFNVKENYPKVYQMIKQGVVPEVEQLQVIDLDNSYKKLSRLGIFGRLVKPLYDDKKIKRTTITIPRREIDLTDRWGQEIAAFDIDMTKKKIENAIAKAVSDNGPEVMLLIDSMSSYDELLNDKFRIIYESVLAEEDKQKYGSSLDGVKQSYWKIRNGWWIETLRDKRSYNGWQFDTYKAEEKLDLWYEKEVEMAKKKGKDLNSVKTYKIQWAPKTEFDLDMVFMIDNDGNQYWAELKHRFEGNIPVDMRTRCYYPKNKRSAMYDILEKVAPYILGEVEKEDGTLLSDDELW